MEYNYLPSFNFLHIGVPVEVTSFILSVTIKKSLFAGILMSEIVMRKLALKTRYDSAKIGMVGISENGKNCSLAKLNVI